MTALTVKRSGSISFGPFVLIPERQLLLQNGARVRIGRRAFDILLALVQRPGEVVSKRELISHAWPDILVDDGNLKVNIATLRHLLGEESGPSRYIATVTGRGYRFVAAVQFSALDHPALICDPLPKRANNLPACNTRVFGRTEAVSAILRDLATSRLVSIIGPGGVGKTTVALAVAELATESFDAGVWLVEFASLADQSLIPNAIAKAIGANARSANMSNALCNDLRDRNMLLMFDNCEHLIDEVAYWADRILRSAKNVALLATSREPLCVTGERVRRLSGLRAPPIAERIDADEAMAFPAVQLFVDRASAACGSFKLDDENAATVAEICHRLDGLPLAIDRVTTRVDAGGVGKMLDHLDKRFHMFDGYHAGPDRHRTLTASVDWGYSLLPAAEQAIMRKLSIFNGAFSLDSACAVAGGDGVEPAEAMQGVANLVAKSLLCAEARDGEMEYRQSRVTRAFALEKLIENGEVEGTRRRHAEHVFDLAERATLACDALSKAGWHVRHGAKAGDITDALKWASNDPASALLAVRLTVAEIPLLAQDSMAGACRTAIERVLQDRFSAYRSARDDMNLRLALGVALLRMGAPVAEVLSSLVKALEIATALGDVNKQMECIGMLSKNASRAEPVRSSWHSLNQSEGGPDERRVY